MTCWDMFCKNTILNWICAHLMLTSLAVIPHFHCFPCSSLHRSVYLFTMIMTFFPPYKHVVNWWKKCNIIPSICLASCGATYPTFLESIALHLHCYCFMCQDCEMSLLVGLLTQACCLEWWSFAMALFVYSHDWGSLVIYFLVICWVTLVYATLI